jgi:hypothetical protein
MRNKLLAPNIDNSNPSVYPNGRIKDNTSSGNGTPVNEFVYGDLHEMKDKLMRLYGIVPNDLPDNESNGFQLIDALRALASKNDFILDLTDSSGILQVPIKLGFMLQKESVLCLSGVNFTAQTQIKGIDNVTYTISILGSFKSGEYVRLIKTSSGITLIREVDAVNLDLAVSEFNYLKKASQTEENAGTIDTKATTPLVNKVAFTRRVNGVDSDNYLATPSQNGLLSKEDKDIIDNIGDNPIKNKGWVSGLDVSGSSGPLSVSGDFSSANASLVAGVSVVNVFLSNNMSNLNYLCQMFIESQGVITNDNRIANIVFKPISVNQFQFCIGETGGVLQNLKIHIKVEQL